ncbi:hypothetical protein [Paenirhodobacter sp.]
MRNDLLKTIPAVAQATEKFGQLLLDRGPDVCPQAILDRVVLRGI